jgi:tRNA A37 threonylcarbamoyladenosine dehydratase
MDRFLRIERLLGRDALEALKNSTVTVVGLGAVGGYAVEGLARAGVGGLRLVDFDRIRTHNINRQLIALDSTVGMKKVEAIALRVSQINPRCRVDVLDLFADKDTAGAILEPKPDLLIDAIDSLNPKFELLTEAVQRGIPILSSMGAALRTDPSKIRVADLMETKKCPLARRLRKKLRKHWAQDGITCVYSEEDVDFEYRDPEQDDEDAVVPGYERGRPRRVLGSLPTITGVFGLILANIAIQKLVKDLGRLNNLRDQRRL